MGVPFVTKVSSSINMSQARSATEVTDAFQQAIFNIEGDAKRRELEIDWGSAQIREDESDTAYASIMDSGPWLTFDAVGRRS